MNWWGHRFVWSQAPRPEELHLICTTVATPPIRTKTYIRMPKLTQPLDAAVRIWVKVNVNLGYWVGGVNEALHRPSGVTGERYMVSRFSDHS